MAGEIDWLPLRNDYIYGVASYKTLSQRYGVSINAIGLRGKAEGWPALRREKRQEVARQAQQQTETALVAQEVERALRVQGLADGLLARLEQASQQLDSYQVTNKRKVKRVDYGEDKKPAREETTQEEQLAVRAGLVDRQGLKVLAAALKDLHSLTAAREAPDNGCLLELIAGLREESGPAGGQLEGRERMETGGLLERGRSVETDGLLERGRSVEGEDGDL